MWFVFALGSAVFAALTSILAKIGIDGVNSTLATAIRTAVVLLMSWGMVFLTGTQTGIGDISHKSWLFLILSGLATGASNLSGGQKQRLCIARALIGKAKILIFDDSTSAVDTATEKKIREALAARKDVTKIIIAQRVTSVMNTDQIIILDDGKVHRIGTHAELLADDPIYQEIYASQMKGGDENGSESL